MKKASVEMLTAKQFAERAQVSYPTVIKWLRNELIPGAERVTDDVFGTYWKIPATSINSVYKRKPGPKLGSKQSKKRVSKNGKPSKKKGGAAK